MYIISWEYVIEISWETNVWKSKNIYIYIYIHKQPCEMDLSENQACTPN